MSLQQNNINKFPKHLQHVRLQKEDEEEQWISGEELCTEGSSDEENTNDVKKKYKPKPIHLPSKESLQIKMSTSSLSSATSLSSSAKESDEENTDSTESSQKTPTQWRPKRGSIKLPNIVEKPLDIENEIFNTEFEYQEAIKELKTLKNEMNATENDNEAIEFDDNVEINLDDNDILTMEEDLKKLNIILQECKQDRMNFQNEICIELMQLSSTSLELENTKKFHDIFRYKSDSNLDNFQNRNILKPKFKRKVKPFSKKLCKYAHRKKKMTDVVLNKEERARLKYLLSDIEVLEIDYNNGNEKDNNTKKEIKNEKVNSPRSENGFRSTEEELQILQKIEQELKTLQEMCDDADLKGKLSEDIYSIDEENREWKAYLKLTEDKFRRIDDKINKLREQDDPKEKEVTTDNL